MVGAQPPDRRIECADELDALADKTAQQTFQTRDHGIERQNFRVHRLFGAECEELSDQRRGPFSGLQHFFGLSAKGVLRTEFRQEDLAVAHDDSQEIIEVMRNPSGQPANRFHLLGLPKLFLALPKGLLCPFPFGAVIELT